MKDNLQIIDGRFSIIMYRGLKESNKALLVSMELAMNALIWFFYLFSGVSVIVRNFKLLARILNNYY